MTRRDAWKISTDGTEGERHAERGVGSARRECLDRMLIVSQRHQDEVHLEECWASTVRTTTMNALTAAAAFDLPRRGASQFDGQAALLEDARGY